ncbi:MAG: hypothetical protein AB8B87_25540 [Granulosicoccus sp.]
MTTHPELVKVRLSSDKVIEFRGVCLTRVAVLDHDERVRRQFAVFSHDAGYVAERIDYPETIDVRFWGALCVDAEALYQFFGNEPLANYLYGTLRLSVPGFRNL